MTTMGWLFLLVAWGAIIVSSAWCVKKVIWPSKNPNGGGAPAP
jgi:hypothetical protein